MATQGPQFDGFLGGWLGAEDRRQEIKERDRQNAAYEAFVSTYGPMAGDPVAYGQLAGIKRAEDRHPLELQGLELGNEGSRVAIDQSNALFPSTLKQAELGNVQLVQTIDQAGQRFPLEQQMRRENITGAQIGNEGAMLGNEATRDAMGDADAMRRRQAITTGVRLLKGVRDSGGDLGIAYDRIVPTLQAIGIDPGEIQQTKDLILARPETLDNLEAALSDPPTPAQAAAAAKAAADPEAGMTEEDKYLARERGKLAAKAEAAAFDREAANETVVAKAEAAGNDIKSAVAALRDPDVIEDAFGWSALGRNINSSDYANAANSLLTLKSKIRLNVIQMLKDASATGATGFGALSDTEGKVLESKFGALTPEMSPEEADKVLGEIDAQVDTMIANAKKIAEADSAAAKKKAQALYRESEFAKPKAGAAPAAGGGGKAPLPLPPELQAAPEGSVVEDDQGRRYLVTGGQLVPQ